MSFEPIASAGGLPADLEAAPAASKPDASVAATPPPDAVVSRNVTSIMPPGYTQTQTVKADGRVTTVVTNATGSTVAATYGTATMKPSELGLSVWA